MTAAPQDAAWAQWLARLESVDSIPELLSDPADEQTVMELYQYAMLMALSGYQFVVASDPKAPFWQTVYTWPYGSHGASPDIRYHYTQIDEDGVYRIWGRRNTIHVLNFQIGTPTWGAGALDGFSVTLDNYDVDDLQIGADGSFEVILSAERPADWSGDWWLLQQGKDPHGIWVRQIMNDWLSEVDAEIHIERLDTDGIPERPSAGTVRQRFVDVAKYIDGATRNWTKHIHKMRDKGLVNTLEYERLVVEGGYAAQSYWQGSYELKPDEALIISTRIPDVARYWNVQITDELYLPLEYPTRLTSVNGAQAWLAPDRMFYAVISETDPGVPNWLDTGGYLSGSILGRWNRCSSEPTPEVTKIPISETRDHLPAETPVVSPQQRREEMLARRRAFLNRIEK